MGSPRVSVSDRTRANAASKRWREANPEKVRAAQGAWVKNRRAETGKPYLGPARQARQDYVDQVKSGPCLDCGGKFPAECMDFDHVRGAKIAGVSALLGRSAGLELIIEEIKKCDLICANCHRIRTRKRHYEESEHE